MALLVPKYLGMAARYVAIIWPALIVYAVRGKIGRPVLNLLVSVALMTTLVISIDQFKNPYGSKTLKDYVAIAEKAKELFPKNTVCKVPLDAHWQVLTRHKSQIHGEDMATYFVGLSETAPQDLSPYKDVEKDALQSARKVSDILRNHPRKTEKVIQNDTFALYQVVLRE